MGRRRNRKSKSSKSSNGGAVQAGTTTPSDAPADAAAGHPRPALAAVAAQINNIGPTNANSNAIGTEPFVFGSPHIKPIKASLNNDDVPVVATPSPVGVDSTPVQFDTPAPSSTAATANAAGDDAVAPAIDVDEMSLPTLIDGSTTEEEGFSSSNDDTDSEGEEDDGADENVKPTSSAPGDTAAAANNNNDQPNEKDDYPQDQKRTQSTAKPNAADIVGGVGSSG